MKLPKETKAQHFPDLDLLTKLMASKSQSASATVAPAGVTPALPKPLIEVVGESSNSGPDTTEQQPAEGDSDDEGK